ncbi:class A beta-lactamase-related serine hydrolase [Pontibacter sp. HSC-14F20]|uniref:serine hydrolase n=1 Tax=Pontibacter sp. HSC-14F20 TaxID=2864136 RepID=UPI001C7388F0|nr:serine hydrolase [Pontibacter sp. HSC-14F20]MBX0332338.1 class A beta-lactamase-related serine hydrolase [Pontibacter sp. HSC-14F20]
MYKLVLYLSLTGSITITSCAGNRQGAGTQTNMIEKILASEPGRFKHILNNPEQYRVQILYTQIDRDEQNQPHFTSYTYRVNPQEYFYPASTVKLPGAVVALEKFNDLGIDGLDKYTPLQADSAYQGQSPVREDSTSADGQATIAHYIKKLFLVSDNDAYNRLYEFVGQQQLNQSLHAKGFKDVQLVHRLSISLSPDENRHTNPFRFYKDGQVIYEQPLVSNQTPFTQAKFDEMLGKGHIAGDKLVDGPMDFTVKNYISIETLQGILKSVLFPEAMPAEQRFHLTDDDYTFLYKYMSMMPRESDFPAYDPKKYPDGYVKFLLYGNSKARIPENIRIFNKIGNAYGFLIDNAYIVDFDKQVEFMLTAVILVNENGIFNDGKYEYETVGYPFMQHLGRAFYEHELKRKKQYLPNLDKFKLQY